MSIAGTSEARRRPLDPSADADSKTPAEKAGDPDLAECTNWRITGAVTVDAFHNALVNLLSFGLLEGFAKPALEKYLHDAGYSEHEAQNLAAIAIGLAGGTANWMANKGLQAIEAAAGWSRMESKTYPAVYKSIVAPITSVGSAVSVSALTNATRLSGPALMVAGVATGILRGLTAPLAGWVAGLSPAPSPVKMPDTRDTLTDAGVRTMSGFAAAQLESFAHELPAPARTAIAAGAWYGATMAGSNLAALTTSDRKVSLSMFALRTVDVPPHATTAEMSATASPTAVPAAPDPDRQDLQHDPEMTIINVVEPRSTASPPRMQPENAADSQTTAGSPPSEDSVSQPSQAPSVSADPSPGSSPISNGDA